MINRDASGQAEHTGTVIRAASDARLTLSHAEARFQEYLLTGLESALSAYAFDIHQVQDQLAGLAELSSDNPDQAARWRAIQPRVEALESEVLQPMIGLREQAAQGLVSMSEVRGLDTQGGAQRGFLAVHAELDAAIDIEGQLLAQRTKMVDDVDVFLVQVLVWGTLATVALGVTFAAVLSTSVGRSMERLARVAQAIAAGDLSQRIALKRTDEIGRAANAFDAMASALERDVAERARSQAATDSLLNAAAEGIYSLDRAGAVYMMNRAAERMTGYTLEELRGRVLHLITHHSHADGSPYPLEECPTVAALNHGDTRHVRGEVFWRKDGTSFPVEYTAVPIQADGHIGGAVVTFHDITQQLAVERMKNEFISIASHELRTPLTSIRGPLGLLASGLVGPLPERAQHMVEVAMRNTDRLIRLVSDILDIERIESGRMPMQLQPENARELVQRSLESITSVADAAGIKLVCHAEPIPLVVDPDKVQQTLTNLLSNAIKFSDRGSEVGVEVERHNGSAVFSVRDQGRGIPPDKLETIFRRFEQVDPSDSRQKGGTGLGLAIARSIVHMHGGQIWVDSTLGRGSTFFFTVPLDEAAERLR